MPVLCNVKASSSMRAARVARPSLLKFRQPVLTVRSAPAPKTGQHQVEDELRKEALAFFFEQPEACVCTPTSGGVNNVVNYVQTPDGQNFILRVYNNGNMSEKVYYEHEILRQLNLQTLSFDTPKALLSKNGKPYEQLSSGAEACIFYIIPGSLAKTTSPEEVGRATGELCTAMAKVTMDVVAPTAPYGDLFRAHHAMLGDSSLLYREVENNPEFNVCREAIDYLVVEIKKIEAKLEEFKAMGLPTQVIHGDLHYDNVMVTGDQVSGLLDFEFCVYDWRAMELAVALSKYVGEDEPLPLISRFVEGYAKTGDLTSAEIDVIPDFINLRIFSNVVYFTGRALAGEDSIDSLTSRAGTYAKRVKWVNANRAEVVQVIKDKMLALAAAGARA